MSRNARNNWVTNPLSLLLVSLVCHLPLPAQNIIGPSQLCPGDFATYDLLPVPGCAGSQTITWSVNDPQIANATGIGSSTSVSVDFDVASTVTFELTAFVTCTVPGDPPTTSSSTFTKTVTVHGLGDPSVSYNPSSFICQNTSQNHTAMATAGNATTYSWTMSYGASIVGATNGINANILSPACGGEFGGWLTVSNSFCPNFQKTTPFSMSPTLVLPSSISGLSSICSDGSGKWFKYSVTPIACATYDWHFVPATTEALIYNAHSATCGVVGSPNADGDYTLVCEITGCGESGTLQKVINICPSSPSQPSVLTAQQAGNSCYYKFVASGVGCADYYEWNINGTLSTSQQNFEAEYEPGMYTVSVRAVNACGISAWRTRSFNLPPIQTNPPCLERRSNPAIGVPLSSDGGGWIRIYPNPATEGRLHVDLDASLVGARIKVVDAAGKVWHEGFLTSAQEELPIAALPTGLFVAQVSRGNASYTVRFLVQK